MAAWHGQHKQNAGASGKSRRLHVSEQQVVASKLRITV